MKKIIIGLLLILSIFLVACEDKLIGGQKDEYGCLTGAGYSWNETIAACVKQWELDESQAKAAQMVVAPMSMRPIIIEKVDTLRCPGCFVVYVKSGDSEKATPIKVIDWKISYEILSFEECVAAGNPVMESYPRQCSADGKTFTEEIEHVCTEEESKATACTMEYMPVCGKIVLNMGKTVYQTFGNKCSACAAMKVYSYTPGECPPEKTTDMCSDLKGNYMTLTEAVDIAKSSECGNNLILDCTCPDGYRKDGDACNPNCYYSKPPCLSPSLECEKTYFCNEGTGTYWINLNLTKQGCSPACVINVETQKAEINWRCTGLLR